MSSLNTWICDGVPKNGQKYPNCSGSHLPYENYSADCVICGLPKAAMLPQKNQKIQETVVSSSKSSLPIPFLFGLGFGIALGAGFILYEVYQPRQFTNQPIAASEKDIISATAVDPQLISQGEKILLPVTNLAKNQGAAAFAQHNWDAAIFQYQKAEAINPNDPEAKIYLNNAQAEKAGKPLTIAVSLPISNNPSAAQEVLRGVALAQSQFNSPPLTGHLLQVVIVDEASENQAPALAQDLINSPNVLGVLTQGIDNASRASVALYQQAGLTVVSPISTSITHQTDNQSILKTIPLAQTANELLGAYLQQAATTLAKYASQKQFPAAVAVFYDSSSLYSQQMKDQFITALTQVHGKAVKQLDINRANFNPVREINSASQLKASFAFLALNKNKLAQAVEIAKANAATKALKLLGDDQLYDPNLLIQGQDAIKGIVLAVPWSWQPNDPFAAQSAAIWKGRVSWRTATAHDATVALAGAASKQPTRLGVAQLFRQGIPLPPGTATNFNVFNQIPLVQAVKGVNGPPGSNYEFDPI